MSPRWDEADRGRGRSRSRSRSRAERWRLFVASLPPAPVRRRLAEAAAGIHPELRCVDPATIHLTWVFIGDVAPAVVEEIHATIEHATRGISAMWLQPSAFAPLPDPERPRLVAAVAEPPPGMIDLQTRLSVRLTSARPGPRERSRPFRPHLTVGRWPGGRGPRPAPPMRQVPPATGFRIDHLSLVRSRLRPEGAEHLVLGHHPLAPAGSGGA